MFVVAEAARPVNTAIVEGLARRGHATELVRASSLPALARPGDTAVGRLDVLPTLDGVERGIWELRKLERSGVHVLNGAEALLASHDKLLTAVLLGGRAFRTPRRRTSPPRRRTGCGRRTS